jgi:hypothetical protein
MGWDLGSYIRKTFAAVGFGGIVDRLALICIDRSSYTRCCLTLPNTTSNQHVCSTLSNWHRGPARLIFISQCCEQ